MQRDMTVGSPFKVVLNFTIPIFIGNVFQQFYNMADAVIVGKFVGTDALAAVGSTGTIMFLIFGLITGMSVGFTVLTSQYYGAGDMDGMAAQRRLCCRFVSGDHSSHDIGYCFGHALDSDHHADAAKYF